MDITNIKIPNPAEVAAFAHKRQTETRNQLLKELHQTDINKFYEEVSKIAEEEAFKDSFYKNIEDDYDEDDYDEDDYDEDDYDEDDYEDDKEPTEIEQALMNNNLYLRGSEFIRKHEFHQAKKCFLKILETDPNNDFALEDLKNIEFIIRDTHDFDQLLTDATKRLDEIYAKTSQTNKFRKQKLKEKFSPIILKADLSNINDLNKQGRLLLEQSQVFPLKAIKTFQRVLKHDPTNDYACSQLANIFIQEGRPKAKKIFQTILKHDPTHPTALFALATILSNENNEKKYPKIEHLYQTAIKNDPTCPSSQNNLGFLYYKQKKFTQAEIAYQKALKLDPTHINAINNLAKLYYVLEKFTEAKEIYRTALKYNLTSEIREKLNTKLGKLLAETNNLPKAKQAFEEALKHDPSNNNTWINLGECLNFLNQPHKAEKLIQTALKYQPTNISFLNLLAYTLALQDKLDEAIQTCQTSLKYEPNNALTLYCLGAISGITGDYDISLDMLRKVLQTKTLKHLKNKKNRSGKYLIQQIWLDLAKALKAWNLKTAARKAIIKARNYKFNKFEFLYITENLFKETTLLNNSSEIGFSKISIEAETVSPTKLITTANSDYT